MTLKDMKVDWQSCLDNKVGFKVRISSWRLSCYEKLVMYWLMDDGSIIQLTILWFGFF